jgi:hypothetical protein
MSENLRKYFSSSRYNVWFWFFWGVLALVWIAVLERADISSMDKMLIYGLVLLTFMCWAGGQLFRKSGDRSETTNPDSTE